MKIAVSGGSGVVGREVVAGLRHTGHEVLVLGRPQGGRQGVVETNYTMPHLVDILSGVEAVIHLAWRREPSSRLDPWFPGLATTQNLVEAAVAVGASRFLGASSIAVYSGTGPWSEDDSVRPATAYGLSKHVEEQVTRLLGEGRLSTLSLRLGHVFAADEENDYAVNAFIRQAEAGLPITVTGDSDRRRDLVYVADVSDAFCSALARPDVTGVLNIGSGSPVSLGEFAEAAAAAFGADTHVNRMDTACGGEGGTELDISLAKDRLGYHPSYDVRQALVDIARRRRQR
ncbi:NAD-dependent epimerase/dehydratase family protein [Knoellia sp. LjRoot47]|uniref:NAD-dependent epimerase/dehydratase family protein n=1 Tax=Knoellia sp. LjRoot47 TaxID=3342330 RepID=UPI003ED122BC